MERARGHPKSLPGALSEINAIFHKFPARKRRQNESQISPQILKNDTQNSCRNCSKKMSEKVSKITPKWLPKWSPKLLKINPRPTPGHRGGPGGLRVGPGRVLGRSRGSPAGVPEVILEQFRGPRLSTFGFILHVFWFMF